MLFKDRANDEHTQSRRLCSSRPPGPRLNTLHSYAAFEELNGFENTNPSCGHIVNTWPIHLILAELPRRSTQA